jgi:CubicO group peptidase (beta-lactamase class C family)
MKNLRRKSKTSVFFWGFIIMVLFAYGCSSSSSDSNSKSFLKTISNTTAYIKSEMEKHNAVGLSIALVSDDKVVWSQGFGWADKENKIAATADTVYMLGSGTKTLTTVALLKLVEQGIISLDQPTINYLPEFSLVDRFPNQMQNITVRRLLNHHSGIPGDLYNAAFLYGERPWNQWGSCDVYMNWLYDYLSSDYPSHPPGQMATYCNTGFVLAGEIALREDGPAGENYPDYLARSLFEPLGMDHTSLFVINENLAKGYEGGQPTEVKVCNCTFGATGGAFTTVKDMARFLIMVNNGGVAPDGARILKPETVAMLGEAEKSSLDIDSFFQPGLGLDTMDDPVMKYAGRAWMKSGGTGDFHSLMEMLPDEKLSVVVLTNADTASTLTYGVVRKCLKQAVLEKYGVAPSPPDLPTYVSLNDPSEIEGIYVKKYGYDKMVDNGDGTLTWIRNAQADAPESLVLTYQDDAYRAAGRTESIIFKNMPWEGMDYFVMIQSGSSGSDADEYVYGGYVRTIVGQKVSVPILSEAWKARLGVYVIDNLPWDVFQWSEPFSLLAEKENILIRDMANAAIPENDDTAFLVGLASRSDSSIRVIQEDGREKLLCGGYKVYPIEQVPPIASGDVVSGTVSLFKTDWYRFDASAGQTVNIMVSTDPSNYALTLFDPDLNFVAREMGAMSWTAAQGSYFVAISPTLDASGDYTMSVN